MVQKHNTLPRNTLNVIERPKILVNIVKPKKLQN